MAYTVVRVHGGREASTSVLPKRNGITALDRELAAIYFARDPRLRRKTA